MILDVTGYGDATAIILYAVLSLYVLVSLTIPFWVPILQKTAGHCGVYWVRVEGVSQMCCPIACLAHDFMQQVPAMCTHVTSCSKSCGRQAIGSLACHTINSAIWHPSYATGSCLRA